MASARKPISPALAMHLMANRLSFGSVNHPRRIAIAETPREAMGSLKTGIRSDGPVGRARSNRSARERLSNSALAVSDHHPQWDECVRVKSQFWLRVGIVRTPWQKL